MAHIPGETRHDESCVKGKKKGGVFTPANRRVNLEGKARLAGRGHLSLMERKKEVRSLTKKRGPI